MATAISIEPVLLSAVMESYTGDTAGEHLEGHGTAVFVGGNRYTGAFSGSAMHGTGSYEWAADGVRYTGEMQANKMSGLGTIEWPAAARNGDGGLGAAAVYAGHVDAGLRHGRGEYQCQCRAAAGASLSVRYEGDWVRGVRHGHGRIEFGATAAAASEQQPQQQPQQQQQQQPASYYEGAWRNNRKNGVGRFQYASGNVYEGDWVDDVKEGHGRMHWHATNEVYVGQWQRGLPHGRGTYYWLKKSDKSEAITKRARRNYYEGEFFQGRRQGQGTMHYADGSRYVGAFVDNAKHADLAVFIYPDGRVYRGAFEHDRMVSPALNGGQQPLPTPGRPLPAASALHIEDLLQLCGTQPAAVEHEQVEHVLLRHVGQLRALYAAYSRIGGGGEMAAAPDDDDDTWLLSQLQLSQLLADCRVPSRQVDSAALLRAIAPSYAAEAGLVEPSRAPPDAQDPDRTVLFRQFLEGLVRVAHVRYPSNGALVNRLSQLLSAHLLATLLQDRHALHDRQRSRLLDLLVQADQQPSFQSAGDSVSSHAAWLTDRPVLPVDLTEPATWALLESRRSSLWRLYKALVSSGDAPTLRQVLLYLKEKRLLNATVKFDRLSLFFRDDDGSFDVHRGLSFFDFLQTLANAAVLRNAPTVSVPDALTNLLRAVAPT